MIKYTCVVFQFYPWFNYYFSLVSLYGNEYKTKASKNYSSSITSRCQGNEPKLSGRKAGPKGAAEIEPRYKMNLNTYTTRGGVCAHFNRIWNNMEILFL